MARHRCINCSLFGFTPRRSIHYQMTYALQRPFTSSTAQQNSSRRVTAAAASSPGISLKRFADAQPSEVVTERRAADVAVLGSSATAVLAAYSLAKSGRKVLLLSDYGLSAPTPRPRPLQPLKLPDPDPLLTHLAAESAAYWGGLQALTGATLLAPQQSLDVVRDPEWDHAGAAGFSKLQESCAAVGIPASLLSASEVNSLCRQLQLPPQRASGLLQQDGGVLQATQAAAAARQLAINAGVMVRDGLALRGWRDRGSCFELRASSLLAPDSVTCMYEAETLLLAPGAWAASCLNLFGLSVEGLQAREVVHSRLAVSNGEQLLQLPLVHSWGNATAADAPEQPEGCTLLPSGSSGDTRVTLQQSAAWGLPVEDPFSWQQARFSVKAQRRDEEEEGRELQQPGFSWADLQVQQLHASCSQLMRGLAPLQHPSCSIATSLVNTLPDGRPLVGSHPGFDQGRVVVCCGLAGSTPYGPGSTGSSYQLSPMLAKLAADVVKSGGGSSNTDDALASGLGLEREGLGVSSSCEGLDAWEGLGRLQREAVVSAERREELQDLARDAEKDLVGSSQ